MEREVSLEELERFALGNTPPKKLMQRKKFQEAIESLGGVKVDDILLLPGGVRWKVVRVDISLCRVIAREIRGNKLLKLAQEISILSAKK